MRLTIHTVKEGMTNLNLNRWQLQVTAIKEIKFKLLIALRQLVFFTKNLATGHFGTPDAYEVGTRSIHLSTGFLPTFSLLLQTFLDKKYVYFLVKENAVV